MSEMRTYYWVPPLIVGATGLVVLFLIDSDLWLWKAHAMLTPLAIFIGVLGYFLSKKNQSK